MGTLTRISDILYLAVVVWGCVALCENPGVYCRLIRRKLRWR